MFLEESEFLQVVKNTPLVSIDIIPRLTNGEVLLGLRRNRPAQGSWFVPGGRIQKGEPIADAFRRLTSEELGQDFEVEQARFLGVFECFYPDNYGSIEGFGTHYVVLAYELILPEGLSDLPRDQHHHFRWWGVKDLVAAADVHPYTKVYFTDIYCV